MGVIGNKISKTMPEQHSSSPPDGTNNTPQNMGKWHRLVILKEEQGFFWEFLKVAGVLKGAKPTVSTSNGNTLPQSKRSGTTRKRRRRRRRGIFLKDLLLFWFSVASLFPPMLLPLPLVVAVQMRTKQLSSSSTTTTNNTNNESSLENEKDTLSIEDLPVDGHLNFHHLDYDEMIKRDDGHDGDDCTCRQHQSQHTANEKAKAVGGARMFYLVLVHNEPTLRDAIPLFRALRDPRHTVVFHVDLRVQEAIDKNQIDDKRNATRLKAALEALQHEMSSCPCGSRVHIASVHKVEWSHWSMNLPTLWGMELALSQPYKNKWDVFINLSGDTLPVYTPNTMAHIFDRLRGYNFVTSRSCETGMVPTNVYQFPIHWHKRMHYTNHERDGRPLIYYTADQGGPQLQLHVEAHFGSQWVALQPAFCEYLVTSLQRADSFPSQYRDYLRKTRKVMTDETFLPTVLMHVAPFNTTTLPQVKNADHKSDDNVNHGVLVYGNSTAKDFNENALLKRLPQIRALRYERMDEHFPSALTGYFPKHPRYEVPATSGVPQPRVWGPYYLGVYDLANIKASGALFVRKTSTQVDPNLYHLLPVDSPDQIPSIQWPPNGVQTSDVPNWQEEKRALMKRAAQKAMEEGKTIPERIRQELEEMDEQDTNKVLFGGGGGGGGGTKEQQQEEESEDQGKHNEEEQEHQEAEKIEESQRNSRRELRANNYKR